MTASNADLDRLAQALHAVRLQCDALPVVAIRWMHLRHPLQKIHDLFLRQDGAWVQEGGGWRHWAALLRRLGQCVAYACLISAQLLWLRWSLRRQLAALKSQPFDILVRTWCLDTEQPFDGRDFYYGDLQERLMRRGIHMLLLCGDISGRVRAAFANRQIMASPMARIPELCLVPLLAPLSMMTQQLVTCWKLLRLQHRARDPLHRAVLSFASRDCLAPDTALTGLLFWMARAAVKVWRPRAVVTLYEGQAWEPCVWRGVKAADLSCQTIGYQHTVVLTHCLALLHKAEVLRPDIVLCLGPETRRMLTPSHPRSRLVSFGTFRQVPRPEACNGPRPQANIVLVVPETGLLAEARVLFHFAMQAAGRLPDHRFVFRCHPLMPFDRLRPHLDAVPDGQPNVEISSAASIADDFARAAVVLYRSSSSVLYAVLHGVKPVFLHDPSLRNADPLGAVMGWRTVVSSVEELSAALRAYAAMPAETLHEAWQDAASYVRRYLVPVSDESLNEWLQGLR